MNDAKEKFADKALLWRSITMKLVDINIQFAVRTEALKAAVIKKKPQLYFPHINFQT